MAPSKRRKTINVGEIEDIVAKIARVPSKTVSTSDHNVLKNLERNLKMVYIWTGYSDLFSWIGD